MPPLRCPEAGGIAQMTPEVPSQPQDSDSGRLPLWKPVLHTGMDILGKSTNERISKSEGRMRYERG